MRTTHSWEVQDYSPREKESSKKGSPHEELEVVSLSKPPPEKTFMIGIQLGTDHHNLLIKLLQRYEEVFAWNHEDMHGVDANIAIH
ncbi:hypothetical protein LIER_04414 [Lithospermum erythrorhizon]|uniref:Uncharacterized protein n=1 Tax=Lithospermum erythrorhizon TaxID=34254 RepID=A0AAV3NWU0_LITER